MISHVKKTTKDGNKRFKKWKRTATRLLLLSFSSFAFFLLLFIGCRRDRDEQVDTLASANVESRDAADDDECADRSSSAVKLLREAAFAYANAKFYEDRGYVLWEYFREGEEPRIVRKRRPLELSFAKPNYVKMRFGGASLLSDGRTFRAAIDDPRYADQIVERPAPLVVASIREFYLDSIFAAAAETSLPDDFSWTSPQLVLLFAKDPLRTLVPRGATAKLLEPAYLQYGPDEKDAVYCDRVSVDADGERVYWFNRATRALARVELPTARLRVQEPGATVLSLRIEFPGQILAQNPPDSTVRYEFPPVEPGAETLERFRWALRGSTTRTSPRGDARFTSQNADSKNASPILSTSTSTPPSCATSVPPRFHDAPPRTLCDCAKYGASNLSTRRDAPLRFPQKRRGGATRFCSSLAKGTPSPR